MKRALLFVAAIAAYFVAVLLWVGGDKRVTKEAFDDFSVASTGTKGLSLASKYLARSGRRVDALTLALNDRNVDPRAVVFRIGPQSEQRPLPELKEKALAVRPTCRPVVTGCQLRPPSVDRSTLPRKPWTMSTRSLPVMPNSVPL